MNTSDKSIIPTTRDVDEFELPSTLDCTAAYLTDDELVAEERYFEVRKPNLDVPSFERWVIKRCQEIAAVRSQREPVQKTPE